MSVVLAGYLVPWAWTGFTGNMAWDWIKLLLLLLPLLLPLLVLPRLLDVAEDWMAPDPPSDERRVGTRDAENTPSRRTVTSKTRRVVT